MEHPQIYPDLEDNVREARLELLRELEKVFGPGRIDDFDGIPVYVTDRAVISLA
jgi:hypothetical protein